MLLNVTEMINILFDTFPFHEKVQLFIILLGITHAAPPKRLTKVFMIKVHRSQDVLSDV